MPVLSSVAASIVEKCSYFFGGGFEVVGGDGVVWRGGELFEQSREFKLGEECAAGSEVRGLRAHGIERVLDGDVGVDSDEFF